MYMKLAIPASLNLVQPQTNRYCEATSVPMIDKKKSANKKHNLFRRYQTFLEGSPFLRPDCFSSY